MNNATRNMKYSILKDDIAFQFPYQSRTLHDEKLFINLGQYFFYQKKENIYIYSLLHVYK